MMFLLRVITINSITYNCYISPTSILFQTLTMDNKSRHLKEQNANSLLHSSIIKGNKSTFLEALKLGCNLKSLSKYGDPPLVSAGGVDPYTSHDRFATFIYYHNMHANTRLNVR